MKLYVTSDLHLEFGDLDLVNTDDVDVLILSGDILVARDLERPDDRGNNGNRNGPRSHHTLPPNPAGLCC